MYMTCLPAAEETIAQEERRAEAGELLGLQRLYVCTALSNQPRGELSKPPEVSSSHHVHIDTSLQSHRHHISSLLCTRAASIRAR